MSDGNPFDDPAFLDEVRTVALQSDEVRNIVTQAGQDIANAAKAIAPKKTGLMASRIRSRVTDSVGGPEATITAPAPANLLATAKGYRWQNRAWGHVVHLSHVANFPFLKMARDEVTQLYDEVPNG